MTEKNDEKINEKRPTDLVMDDPTEVVETYRFFKALLDDYSACKTELARNGLKRSLDIMIEKLKEAHSKLLDSKINVEKDLEDLKKRNPKTEKEVKQLLREYGFYAPEEVGSSHFPLTGSIPNLTPKQYGELYRRLYGEMTPLDEKRLDKAIEKFEESQKKFEEESQKKLEEAVCNQLTENEKEKVEKSPVESNVGKTTENAVSYVSSMISKTPKTKKTKSKKAKVKNSIS